MSGTEVVTNINTNDADASKVAGRGFGTGTAVYSCKHSHTSAGPELRKIRVSALACGFMYLLSGNGIQRQHKA